MTGQSSDPTASGVGASPRGELSLREAAVLLGVHRSRIVYWQKKSWLPKPLTKASIDAARQLQKQGLWPPKAESPEDEAGEQPQSE